MNTETDGLTFRELLIRGRLNIDLEAYDSYIQVDDGSGTKKRILDIFSDCTGVTIVIGPPQNRTSEPDHK